jgi:hypothetical protein
MNTSESASQLYGTSSKTSLILSKERVRNYSGKRRNVDPLGNEFKISHTLRKVTVAGKEETGPDVPIMYPSLPTRC